MCNEVQKHEVLLCVNLLAYCDSDTVWNWRSSMYSSYMQMKHFRLNVFLINSFIHSLSSQTIESLNVSSVTHSNASVHSTSLNSSHSSAHQVALRWGSRGYDCCTSVPTCQHKWCAHVYANEAFPGCCGWSWSGILSSSLLFRVSPLFSVSPSLCVRHENMNEGGRCHKNVENDIFVTQFNGFPQNLCFYQSSSIRGVAASPLTCHFKLLFTVDLRSSSFPASLHQHDTACLILSAFKSQVCRNTHHTTIRMS